MFQGWIAVCLDPDTSHGVVKDLIVLDHAKASIVYKDSAVLTSPDLISTYYGITSGSKICTY